MANKGRKRQRHQQKRAAKSRKRSKQAKAKMRDRRKANANERHTHPAKPEVVHAYTSPFGIVLSHQDPNAMHLRPIGGVGIHRPRIAAEVEVRQQAEQALRATYAPGTYTDATQINRILQAHFQFFDGELRKAIPKLGSRHFMEFVLFQYDQSCKVDGLYKKRSLSPDDTKYWQDMGHRWRRALKYLAESSCLLAPEEAPVAPEGEILDLTDRATIYAEELVHLSALSDQTYMLFPDRTELVISTPGELDYLDLRVRPEIGAEFQKRVLQDLQVRDKYIPLDYPLFDRTIRSAELNPCFAQVFGLTYDDCFTLINSLLNNMKTPPNGFPIAFVQRHQVITKASAVTGASPQAIGRLLDGITITRANMLAENRRVWKPKQEHRAYRRAFFDFPHPTGTHLTWSDGMAKEALVILRRDLAFQHVPPEWNEPAIRAGLAALSNRCGKEFERVCSDHLKQRGVLIACSFKDGIGTGPTRILIPPTVGELDCVAYVPAAHQLMLLEYKLVQSGTEAARLRDDNHQFTNSRDGYFLKYGRKFDWLRANVRAVCRALESVPGIAQQIEPTHVAGAIVTLYPSFASYLNPPVPCVSIGEFFSTWDAKQGWPFVDGIVAA